MIMIVVLREVRIAMVAWVTVATVLIHGLSIGIPKMISIEYGGPICT